MYIIIKEGRKISLNDNAAKGLREYKFKKALNEYVADRTIDDHDKKIGHLVEKGDPV